MKARILTFIQLFFAMLLAAQTPLEQDITIINGYARKIEGVDFSYHSSIPIAKESMLIRATDGTSAMEWETSSAPAKLETEFISFVWLAGVGSSPGKASFDVAVNGINKFTFWTDGSDEWLLKASDGSSLWFKKDMIDQHGDRFGFMFLTIPAITG